MGSGPFVDSPQQWGCFFVSLFLTYSTALNITGNLVGPSRTSLFFSVQRLQFSCFQDYGLLVAPSWASPLKLDFCCRESPHPRLHSLHRTGCSQCPDGARAQYLSLHASVSDISKAHVTPELPMGPPGPVWQLHDVSGSLSKLTCLILCSYSWEHSLINVLHRNLQLTVCSPRNGTKESWEQRWTKEMESKMEFRAGLFANWLAKSVLSPMRGGVPIDSWMLC